MTRNTELLSIEKVRELLKDITPGSWEAVSDIRPLIKCVIPMEMLDTGGYWADEGPTKETATAYLCNFNKYDVNCNDADLMAAAPDLARLCLSLAAQLQQEREAREAAEQELAEVRGSVESYSGPVGPIHPARPVRARWQTWREEARECIAALLNGQPMLVDDRDLRQKWNEGMTPNKAALAEVGTAEAAQ